MRRLIWSLALIFAGGTASAAPVVLVQHVIVSGGGAASTLINDGSNCGFPAPSNSAIAAGLTCQASDATWDWDGEVLTGTGLYQAWSHISGLAAAPVVLGDHVVDLVIDTEGDASNAASYVCIEGTFLAGVGAHGCANVNTGANFVYEGSMDYNVGGDARCINRTIGGDDFALPGEPRGVTDVGDGELPGCDAASGAFRQWIVIQDDAVVGGELIIANQLNYTEANGGYMVFEYAEAVIEPVANDDTATVNQDDSVIIDVLANDLDLTDPVTVTITGDPANGTALVNGSPGNAADITITYTPNASYSGPDSFVYTVEDENGEDSATVTITVNEFGANDDTASTRLNTPVLINVLANDVGFSDRVTVTIFSPPDSGGDAVVVTAADVEVPDGTGDSTDLRIRFTPDAALGTPTYTENFTYQVSNASPSEFTLIEVAVTDSPFGPSVYAMFNDEATAVVNGTTVEVYGAGWSSANVNAAFIYEGDWVTELGTGVDIIKIEESCVQGEDAFEGTGGTSCTNEYNGLLGDWITGEDRNGDENELVTYSAEVDGNTLTISRTARFSGNPMSGFFNSPMTVTLTFCGVEPVEGECPPLAAGTDEADVEVTVNNAVPVANAANLAISTQGVDPATATASINAANIAGNALGDAGVVTADTPVGGTIGTITGTTIPFTLAAGNFVGGGSFVYTITDEDGESDFATVTVTTADVAPSLGAGGGSGTGQEGVASITATRTRTLGNGSQAQHTLAIATQAATGTCAAAFSGSNVEVTYTPGAAGPGTYTCVVSLEDGDGDAAPANTTFTFTVTAAPGGGGGGGGLLRGGSSALDLWSLGLLAGLPLLRRRRRSS